MNNQNQTEKIPSKETSDVGFFYRPEVIQWILRIFYVLCALLVIVDFFVHRHIETTIEKVPAFYAIYGFVACVILVWLAAKMRTWVLREENYYENHEEAETLAGSKDEGSH